MKLKVWVLILAAAVLFLNCSNMLGEFLHAAHGSFVINDNSTYTFSTSVTLDIDVIDAEKMRFSNNGTSWSSWEDYAVTKSWILAYGHSGKTVYGEFRHSNGNILQISDVITPLVEEKITASDGAPGDYFSGFEPYAHGSCLSVSSDGSTIVVGASMDNGSGSAYVYKWYGCTWVETKLTASDGVSGDGFGFSVSVSSDGSIVAVGSWWDDIGSITNQGSVYVYRLNGSNWDETKIIASDGANSDNFGLSVSISADGNTIIAGAYHDDPSGSAYVYKWDGINWDETKLIPSDGGSGFGFHVAVSSDGYTAAVGTPFSTGSAYVFKWDSSSWIETKITASDGESNDWFGYSASISSDGNTMIIGAISDHIGGHWDQGSAYIFSWDGSDWNEIKLTASDGETEDWFGYSAFVSPDGSTFAVGAPGDDVGSNVNQGSAYVY